MSCIFFDYIAFSLRTVYSRSVFFIFPDKLKKLKDQRNALGDKIRGLVDKFIGKVDKEYESHRIVESSNKDIKDDNKSVASSDIPRDNFEYLERRASIRKTKRLLISELNMLAQLQTSFKTEHVDITNAEDDESDDENKYKNSQDEQKVEFKDNFEEKNLSEKKND